MLDQFSHVLVHRLHPKLLFSPSLGNSQHNLVSFVSSVVQLSPSLLAQHHILLGLTMSKPL